MKKKGGSHWETPNKSESPLSLITISAHYERKWMKAWPLKKKMSNFVQLWIMVQVLREMVYRAHTGYNNHHHSSTYIPARKLHHEGEIFVQRYKLPIQNLTLNLAALNHTCEYMQPIWAFNNTVLVWTNEAEIIEIQTLMRFSWFKPENALNGDSTTIQNCHLWLA
jgi:hypothetical protein